MKAQKFIFSICIDNDEYPASLEKGKVYRILQDDQAESHGYVRVVDESGEDYMYSSKRFFPVKLPTAVEKVLAGSSAKQTRRPR
jgi:hypothetical protein